MTTFDDADDDYNSNDDTPYQEAIASTTESLIPAGEREGKAVNVVKLRVERWSPRRTEASFGTDIPCSEGVPYRFGQYGERGRGVIGMSEGWIGARLLYHSLLVNAVMQESYQGEREGVASR
jgi:hypothetical protein